MENEVMGLEEFDVHTISAKITRDQLTESFEKAGIEPNLQIVIDTILKDAIPWARSQGYEAYGCAEVKLEDEIFTANVMFLKTMEEALRFREAMRQVANGEGEVLAKLESDWNEKSS